MSEPHYQGGYGGGPQNPGMYTDGPPRQGGYDGGRPYEGDGHPQYQQQQNWR
jgi:hypothetical protein